MKVQKVKSTLMNHMPALCKNCDYPFCVPIVTLNKRMPRYVYMYKHKLHFPLSYYSYPAYPCHAWPNTPLKKLFSHNLQRLRTKQNKKNKKQ